MKLKEELLKYYTKFQKYVFPGVVLLSGSFIIGFIIIPQLSGFIKGTRDLGVERQRLQKLEVKADELDLLDEADLNSKLKVALGNLPTEKDLSMVIGVIQNLGKDSGIILGAVSFGSGEDSSSSQGLSNFTVSVDITSPKANFKQFLTNVENAPIIMKVKSIEISSSGSEEVLSAGVTLEIFYSPTPANLGSVGDEIPKLSPEEEELIVKLSQVNSIKQPPISVSNPPNIPLGKSNPFE